MGDDFMRGLFSPDRRHHCPSCGTRFAQRDPGGYCPGCDARIIWPGETGFGWYQVSRNQWIVGHVPLR